MYHVPHIQIRGGETKYPYISLPLHQLYHIYCPIYSTILAIKELPQLLVERSVWFCLLAERKTVFAERTTLLGERSKRESSSE